MPATWVDPPIDWTAGSLVTSTMANQEWRDRMMYLKASPAFTGSPTIAGTLVVTGAITGAALTGTTLAASGAITGTLATDSTSISTGAIITAGGVGITKALWVGGLTNIAGAVTLQSTLNVTGAISSATSVALTGVTNNVGTITTGVWNAGAVTSSGAISGTTGTFSGLLTVTGRGEHSIVSSGAGGNELIIGTTSAADGDYGFLRLRNNSLTTVGALEVYSSTTTPTAYVYPSVTILKAAGASGLSVVMTHASGPIRFYPGGATTETLKIGTTGAVGITAAQKLYLDGVGLTGDTYITESAGNTLALVSGGVLTTLVSGVFNSTLGIKVNTGGTVTSSFIDAVNVATWDMVAADSGGTKAVFGGYRASQFTSLGLYTSATERLLISTAGVVTLSAYTAATFVAGDKYLVVNASGVLHVSALGPAS